jgi:hypothetical protein
MSQRDSGIQSVTIRRLRKDTRPNWKVADIVPLLISEKVRVTLVRLTGIFALEDERE